MTTTTKNGRTVAVVVGDVIAVRRFSQLYGEVALHGRGVSIGSGVLPGTPKVDFMCAVHQRQKNTGGGGTEEGGFERKIPY